MPVTSSMFRRMDLDYNGALDPGEFTNGMRSTGVDLDDKEIMSLFAAYDENGSGRINMEEFLSSARVKKQIYSPHLPISNPAC